MSRRKKYSKEFKLDAVSLVLDQAYSRAEAARSLGLNHNMLGRWVSEYRDGDGLAFRGNGKLTPEQQKGGHKKGVRSCIAILGSISTISVALQDLTLSFQSPREFGGYDVAHSSHVFVVDPESRLVSYILRDASVDEAVLHIKEIIL